jgi:uncharacterized protein YbjT (DUF2867 family)
VVTGGTGFTGEFVLQALADRGIEPTVLVRASSDRSRLGGMRVRIAEGDLDDPDSMRRAFAGHDCLLSVASIGFGHGPDVVRCAAEAGITRAVFTSTTAILTNLPVRTKPVREAAEAAIRASPLAWTVVRPTMIYGTARDRNVSRLLRWLRKWRVMGLPAGGRAMQQPIHVADVAHALVTCLLTDATAGHTYNISGREPLTFRDLVREAAAAVGVHPLLVPIPLTPVAALVGAAESLRIPVRLRAEQLHRIAEDKAFPHDEAARDFGFAPRSFAEGVREEAQSLGLACSPTRELNQPVRP